MVCHPLARGRQTGIILRATDCGGIAPAFGIGRKPGHGTLGQEHFLV